MKTMKSTLAAAAFAAMMLACASTDKTATTNTDYGRVDPAATAGSVEGTATTPAVIPGPAKVDSDGNLYSSSAAPGTGNGSTIGTNTNVSIVPNRVEANTSLVTYTPVEPAVVAVVETPVIVETPTMTSASTVDQPEPVVEIKTTRRRMAKN